MILNYSYRILLVALLFLLCLIILYVTSRNKNIEHFTEENNRESIRDKVIIITASSSKFGYTLAETLAKYDCKLFITGRTQSKVSKAVEKLEKINKNVHGKAADFAVEKEVRDMFNEAINHYKKIDILVTLPIQIESNRRLKDIKYDTWKNDFVKNMDSVFLLNQLALKHMYSKSIKGKIINCSNFKSNFNSTMKASGAEILNKDMIERYSNLLAEELYNDQIAVCTIRIDSDIDESRLNFNIPLTVPKNVEGIVKGIRSISKLFAGNPRKIIPIFIYAIKAPFHEISGRVISTDDFLTNKHLSKSVPINTLKKQSELNLLFNSNQTKRDKDTIFLVKQNMIGMTPKIHEFIKSRKFSLEGINREIKYTDGPLIDALKNRTGLEKHNFVLFNNENEVLKKTIDLFVSVKEEILTSFPCWTNIIIYSKETDRPLDYVLMKSDTSIGTIQPRFSDFIKSINNKTKLVYLSSPNTVSGQSIPTEEFEKLLKEIPKRIPILLDQRYIEFAIEPQTSKNKGTKTGPSQILNGIDYLDKRDNLLIFRTFANFYGIESLNISYLIGNRDIIEYINNSIIYNSIDTLQENMALIALRDKNHNDYIRKTINYERGRLIKKLKAKDINYYLSETNYMLIEPSGSKGDISKEFEKENIILYDSMDTYNDYWTLPIASKTLNNKVFNIINYTNNEGDDDVEADIEDTPIKETAISREDDDDTEGEDSAISREDDTEEEDSAISREDDTDGEDDTE